MDLGLSIRKMRQKLGYSQLELAVESGVSLATLQNIEGGRANPAWNTVVAICEKLGLEVNIAEPPLNLEDLVDLGCPLMGQGEGRHPSRGEVRKVLGSILPLVRGLQAETREYGAVMSWLCAIRDHFPSLWMDAPKSLRHWFDERAAKAVSLKLRRMALTRLSPYL